MMHQVLITTVKFLRYETFARDFLRERNCNLIEHTFHRKMDEEKLLELVSPAAALIAGPELVTERVFAVAPQLQVVSAPGVGFDHIDVEAATRYGVTVCICPGCNHHAVAEMALGMMIGLARRICVEDRALRGGRWAQTTGSELWGKTLGIVGLGHIGKSIALLGCGMGMRVLATDTARDITFANEHGISYVPLAKLFQESDFVSLHCPLTPETRGLINTATLAQMKSTAYLINTARGPLVDESALAQALREQRIAGAGLDVFETEPPVNSPYLEFDNVILTSHRGGATQEAIESSLEIALLNVTQVLHGQQPIYRVN